MRFFTLTGPCLLWVILGGMPVTAESSPPKPALVNAMASLHDRCMPLADLIASGEGTWDSVNRGWAGDTPRGIKSVTGKSFAEMTIEEVLWLQRGSVYAVGRYQMIPTTFRQAVKWAGLPWNTKFTNEVQNQLFCALLTHKRPSIGKYLLGGGSLHAALDALAKEWASVEYRNGAGYYDRIGGNRAHIKRSQAEVALNKGRGLP